jgi:sterol desaturase/sphingolipid hydroxylase (fatty acid hydroxylase superfamily)
LHAVHHTQEEMSVLTSFRAHPLVHVSFLIAALPALALSANAAAPVTLIVIYTCLASLPHANLRWGFGPIGRIVVSPAYHRLHHASEGAIDVNMGTILTVWDALAGCAVFPTPATTDPIPTGLRDRPIPVEQAGRRARHAHTLAAQLIEPFLVVEPSLAPEPRGEPVSAMG